MNLNRILFSFTLAATAGMLSLTGGAVACAAANGGRDRQ